MIVKTMDQLALQQKRVLLRVDYNVPMKEGQISDDSRIRASLPTIEMLLKHECKITLMTHLGRPKGEGFEAQYSTAPVAQRLSELLGAEVALVSDLEDNHEPRPLQMLENLRFNAGETKNEPAFAAKLARFGEVYINDAFGAAHRAHASTAAICEHYKQRSAGKLLARELHYLQAALKNPQRPFAAILGGSKISDKLRLIENLIEKVDMLLIGGGMSYTFLKARGLDIGNSLVENDFLEHARKLMQASQERKVELVLPLDHLVAETFEAEAQITQDEVIPEGSMGLDLGPETINLFTTKIKQAKTIVWNGPMGVFEWEAYSIGTVSVAEALAEVDGLTLIGGGDSVAAAALAEVTEQITHISTGGGAFLELLAGRTLAGITALES